MFHFWRYQSFRKYEDPRQGVRDPNIANLFLTTTWWDEVCAFDDGDCGDATNVGELAGNGDGIHETTYFSLFPHVHSHQNLNFQFRVFIIQFAFEFVLCKLL
jgi:hypothetical protein